MKRKELFLVLLVIGVLFNSCTHSKKRSEKITIESGQIPPEMATEKFILIGRLYGRGEKSYDKRLAKELDKYAGEKVLATKEEIAEKYTSANGYRYILDFDPQYQESRDANGGTCSILVRRFYIYDQQTGEKYTRNAVSSFWALQIRYYLLAIDAVRLK